MARAKRIERILGSINKAFWTDFVSILNKCDTAIGQSAVACLLVSRKYFAQRAKYPSDRSPMNADITGECYRAGEQSSS
jgi:hypothetical protein